MKTIIIYSSKYGCTEDCAKYLKSRLSGLPELMDADRSNSVSLESYDTVILGSSIYIGRVSKKIQKLCKENVNLLTKKNVGIFLCCAFPEQTDTYLTTNFPDKLLGNAAVIKSFGGEARIEKMRFLDKAVMKAGIKGNHEALKVSYNNMNDFIKKINKLIHK